MADTIATLHKREMHVGARKADSIETQCWAWCHTRGWYAVPVLEAGDWPVDTFAYIDWGTNPIPQPKAPGYPPRALL